MRNPILLAGTLDVFIPCTAVAEIGLPTITPVPIPAGTLITDGGGATLDNFVSQNLSINTTGDWTGAALLLQLDSGSIFQEPDDAPISNGSMLGPPNPAGFGMFPSSEFDTYVDGSGWVGIDGAAGDLNLGGPITYAFDTQSISMAWNDPAFVTDTGDIPLGRYTLSDDAQGSWFLAVTETFNPHVRFVDNPIVNGQLIFNPLIGDLNFDGFVGIEDLNAILGAWNQNVDPGLPDDPSGDGYVGIEDLNLALTNWNTGFQPAQSHPLGEVTGDYNGDGFVGIDDQNIVLSFWNQIVDPGDLSKGDISGDGFVGIEDMAYRHWDNGTPRTWIPPNMVSGPSAPTAVPEPAALALVLTGLIGLLRRRA